MLPAERKKLEEQRKNLKGYRVRLMILKDVVPNINELWSNNDKIIRFFESGEAEKYEAKYKGLNLKPGKADDKEKQPLKVDTDLTADKYRELKTKGVSDKLIREQYKLNTNQLVAWKNANGVTDLVLSGGTPKHKKQKEMEANLVKLTVEVYKELSGKGLSDKQIAERLNIKVGSVYQFKSLNHLTKQAKPSTPVVEIAQKENVDSHTAFSEETKVAAVEKDDSVEKLYEANLYIKALEVEVEGLKDHNNKMSMQLELAQKAERQAIDKLIAFQADYRNLEVDQRNQSSELTRVKAMLYKLKRTEQINVWLMEQHVGFVAQLDELVERQAIGN
ncbi:hypothetical protein [Psychrobacillus sp. FJAT-21963]|uniref:hypothetical protein n=1 Tax=Psychrobacillus sp. FJAT-21963 TaxID=1712028 RepID=UPI0006F626AE|nr:hypothetical protein [Psychrobacillus sp. FJAT-21963]KQL37153.1 hypothetical protein AN959_03690 [Psychrobacillus sp. FJAT-21963]